MSKTVISSPDAPAAIGPYSQAIRSGETLYLSGQIALDPATGQLVDGGVAGQTEQVLKNLRAVLAT
ncbi:MAG: RidA family protein, partial [Myxococcales bacterium]|nr:RidA family protein [Myxococcales bacterium]